MKRRTFDVLASLGGLVLAHRAPRLPPSSSARTPTSRRTTSGPSSPRSMCPSRRRARSRRGEAPAWRREVRRASKSSTARWPRSTRTSTSALHLRESLGGKTYSELSSASRADPDDTELADQVQTAFRGETLRGLLLTSFAFWTLGREGRSDGDGLFPGRRADAPACAPRLLALQPDAEARAPPLQRAHRRSTQPESRSVPSRNTRCRPPRLARSTR